MEKREERRVSFTLRVIHNQIKGIVCRVAPKSGRAPKSQLQGGILGFLYHHPDTPVYQRDIEKEFHISRATATNTLQVMEKNGLIVRRSQDKDARLKRIFMTEEAAANHERVEEHMQQMDDRMLKGMSEAEIEELNRLLGIILSNLEELRAETCAGGEAEEDTAAERTEDPATADGREATAADTEQERKSDYVKNTWSPDKGI